MLGSIQSFYGYVKNWRTVSKPENLFGQLNPKSNVEWFVNSKPLEFAIGNIINSLKFDQNSNFFFHPYLTKIVTEYLQNTSKEVDNLLFSPQDWKELIGEVDIIHPSPEIEIALHSENPFFTGKKIHETCLLIFMPNKVNDITLTPNSIEEMCKNPLYLNINLPNGFERFDSEIQKEFGESYCNTSYWMLINKDEVFPNLRSLHPKWDDQSLNQEQLYQIERFGNWTIPNLRDNLICSIVFFVKTNTNLFTTPRRCSEQFCKGKNSLIDFYQGKGGLWKKIYSNVIVGSIGNIEIWSSDAFHDASPVLKFQQGINH